MKQTSTNPHESLVKLYFEIGPSVALLAEDEALATEEQRLESAPGEIDRQIDGILRRAKADDDVLLGSVGTLYTKKQVVGYRLAEVQTRRAAIPGELRAAYQAWVVRLNQILTAFRERGYARVRTSLAPHFSEEWKLDREARRIWQESDAGGVVISYDQVGYGDSPAETARYGIERFAGLAQLVKQFPFLME